MYKYLFSIIIGIILFVYYYSINKFSIGIPNFFYLKNYSGNWEVKNTLDPTLKDFSDYTERLKDTFFFPHIVEAREYKDSIVTNQGNIHISLEENDRYCYKYPIIIDVQDKLVELNTRLQTKCPSLRLDAIDTTDISELTEDISDLLESIYSPPFLILCLYYNDECISSCIYSYNNLSMLEGNSIDTINSINTIMINLDTNEEYRKRKYMSLLSSVMFMTASMIICNARIKSLYFICINPITAYYLLSNFKCTTKFLNVEKQTAFNRITEYTFENLETFMDSMGSIQINVELTPENISKAQKIFNKLVGNSEKSIICPEVELSDTTCGA